MTRGMGNMEPSRLQGGGGGRVSLQTAGRGRRPAPHGRPWLETHGPPAPGPRRRASVPAITPGCIEREIKAPRRARGRLRGKGALTRTSCLQRGTPGTGRRTERHAPPFPRSRGRNAALGQGPGPAAGVGDRAGALLSGCLEARASGSSGRGARAPPAPRGLPATGGAARSRAGVLAPAPGKGDVATANCAWLRRAPRPRPRAPTLTWQRGRRASRRPPRTWRCPSPRA